MYSNLWKGLGKHRQCSGAMLRRRVWREGRPRVGAAVQYDAGDG